MARSKREKTPVTKSFSAALREYSQAKKQLGKADNEIWEGIGIAKSSYFDYCNDLATPTIDTLFAICKYFNVSADGMLGLAEPGRLSEEEKLRMISSYTGLSISSVAFLHYLHEVNVYDEGTNEVNGQTLQFLNRVLEGEGSKAVRDKYTGATEAINTLFRIMELYIHADDVKAKIKGEGGTVITFDDNAMPLFGGVSSLYRTALLDTLKRELDNYCTKETDSKMQ